MSRLPAFLAALAVAAPVSAATYAGKPAASVTEARFVGRDIIWNYAGGRYQGRTDESRPLVICQSLAKRAGRLESFSVDGRSFADADLAKCNAAAPASSDGALAEAN